MPCLARPGLTACAEQYRFKMKSALILIIVGLGLGVGVTPAISQGRPVLVTLGTGGGPIVQTRRSQPANAIVTGGLVYLFDTGEGTQRALRAAELPLAKVRAVFLTHHHLDHVGGLGPIIVNRWILGLKQPLLVFGPPGTRELVAGLVAAAGPTERAPLRLGGGTSVPLSSTVVAADAVVGDRPVEIYRDGNIRVLAIDVDHFHKVDGSRDPVAQSFGFRIETGGRSIVISGDTGPSAALEKLAQGADLLLSEVMDRPAIAAAVGKIEMPPAARAGFLRHMDLDHLTPAQVGDIAARAGVKAVVLTHLVPGLDGEHDTSGYTAGLSRHFSGPVTVAKDGDRF